MTTNLIPLPRRRHLFTPSDLVFRTVITFSLLFCLAFVALFFLGTPLVTVAGS